MGAGDLTFCQVETDFPTHRRCVNLMDNNSRWLYVCLWAAAVRTRSPVLDPKRHDNEWIISVAHLDESEINVRLNDLAMRRLIAFTARGHIVVLGVQRKHPRVRGWAADEPEEEDLVNPYLHDTTWRYGQPVELQEDIDVANLPDPLENYEELSTFYAELRGYLQVQHPKKRMPNYGTKAEYKDALALDQLVRTDGHKEHAVVLALRWFYTTEDPDNDALNLLRAEIRTIHGIRSRFRDINALWKGLFIGKTDHTVFQRLWNETATECGWRHCQTMTAERKKELRARMCDTEWRETYQEALEKAKSSTFLRGMNDRNWKADIDWFLRPNTVCKILEDKYGNDSKYKDPNGVF